MRKGLLTTVLALAGIYVVYCGVLFANQRAMLFPRHRIADPEEVNLEIFDAEVVPLQTGFGEIESWFIPPTRRTNPKPYPTVIFAHGNSELIDNYPATYPEQFLRFLDLGMAVHLVEYPGYGRSAGEPSEKTVTEAFVAAYDYVIERGDVDADNIVLFGRSLGGGAVCTLAARRPSRAMILFTTFSSIRDMAGTYMAPGFFVRDQFDNLSVVEAYNGPVLVIHGTEDRLIPYEQGVRLSSAAQQGTLLTYKCGHGDCPPDWDEYWQQVVRFLRNAEVLR